MQRSRNNNPDEIMLENMLNIKEERSAGDKKQTRNIERLRKMAGVLEEMSKNKFTGYIKVNFSQGFIGRIEKFEEILKKEL